MKIIHKLKARAQNLKQDIPTIYLALKDKDTPLSAKILATLALGYALSPIDLIPDFIPVLGYLDDVLILPILIAWTIKLIPDEIIERSKVQAKDMWQDGKPTKWYYALPILVFWLWIIYLVIKAVKP